ncbi:hypothetical protein H0H92_006297 [Tricholoma furcatifolium]|nr:hypothetical protein H0H92_006297 [Tricholoma furcatifolium]
MSVTTLTIPNEIQPCIEGFSPRDVAGDKSRRLIDQEIQRLEDSIRTLRSRRNILAPVSRLPPEMLSMIFSYRVAEAAEGPNPLEWIRVTHVSRHWRAVALDCPNLWGNLVFTRPKWSEEMLRRSKMASLVVKADLSCITPKIFEAVRLALLNGPRISDLQLRASSATLARLLSSEIPFEAPMIQSLSLSVPRATRFGTDEGFTLPDTILNNDTSYLKKLDLRKINISWNSRLLKGLTHLVVHDVAPSARATIGQLMDALERMPALEVLDMQDALPQSSEETSSDRVVQLAHLTQLNITSTVPECANLVSHIAIPTSSRVHLGCSGTEATGGDFSGVMKIISNPMGSVHRQDGKDGPPERKIIRVLHVQHEAPISLVIQGWTNTVGTQEASPTNTPDIQLHFSWHHSPDTEVNNITTAICKAIPLAHLRSLRMGHVEGIATKSWTNLFGFLPKLQDIHIAGDSAHTLICALREELTEPLTSPVTPGGFLGVRRPGFRRRRSMIPSVYFPHLRSLILEDVSFDEHTGASSTVRFQNLQKCLLERSERKSEIQELQLRECSHLYEEQVNELNELVTVDWDKIEQGFMDDDESVYGYDELGGYIFGGYNVYGEDLDLDLDFGFNPGH